MTHTRTKQILEKTGRNYTDAEVSALRDDDQASTFLQDLYGVDDQQAEKMLGDIDMLCEILLGNKN